MNIKKAQVTTVLFSMENYLLVSIIEYVNLVPIVKL